MSVVTKDVMESALKEQYVGEYSILQIHYNLNIFGAVKLQTLQLDDLKQRISTKAATFFQVSKSLENIRTDLSYLKNKVRSLEKQPRLVVSELGAPFPADNPTNTLSHFKNLISQLEGSISLLDDELPKLEAIESEMRKTEGQMIFAALAVILISFAALRSYVN